MLGLYSGGGGGEDYFGGAYYWKEFCVSKWVGLDNKNSLKHYENSLMGLYSGGGLIIRRILRLRFGGLIFGRAYFSGGVIIGILRYVKEGLDSSFSSSTLEN